MFVRKRLAVGLWPALSRFHFLGLLFARYDTSNWEILQIVEAASFFDTTNPLFFCAFGVFKSSLFPVCFAVRSPCLPCPLLRNDFFISF
jgi:hypothetical protein